METEKMLEVVLAAQFIHDWAVLPEEVCRAKYPLDEIWRMERFAECGEIITGFVFSRINDEAAQINYDEMISVLRSNIGTLEKQNEKLQARIAALEGRSATAKTEKPKRTPPARVETPARNGTGRPGEAVIADDQFTEARSNYKGSSSKFKSVSFRSKQSTTAPWAAQVFRDGKVKYIGCHKTELSAAAAVQKYLGNAKLAADLREADRFAGRIEEKHGPRITKIQCVGCAQEYGVRPVFCSKCQGRSFEEIKVPKVD